VLFTGKEERLTNSSDIVKSYTAGRERLNRVSGSGQEDTKPCLRVFIVRKFNVCVSQ